MMGQTNIALCRVQGRAKKAHELCSSLQSRTMCALHYHQVASCVDVASNSATLIDWVDDV
jgi:hypothetical protein